MAKICHFRPPFLWFISFGGAKEMNKKLFETSKMLIYSQKRFEDIPRLTAIRVACLNGRQWGKAGYRVPVIVSRLQLAFKLSYKQSIVRKRHH
jgi:hypothetical protein